MNAGCIDVWLFDSPILDGVCADRLRMVLTPAEIDETRDHVFAADAQRFAASRYWLRLILGDILGQPPQEVEFALGDFGKPCLPAAPAIHFSLSHTVGLTALAIAATAIGIDVERVDRFPMHVCRAPFFQNRELEWLSSHAPQQRVLRCCQLWTAKEAYLKATGEGLRAVHSVTLRSASSRGYHYQLVANADYGRRWYLRPLHVPNGFVGTLAISGRPSHVQYRQSSLPNVSPGHRALWTQALHPSCS